LARSCRITTLSKSECPDNIDVAEESGFVDTGRHLYREFEKAGSHLLKAIAIHLNLPENYFDQYINGGNSILRSIHYPPITSEPASAIRAEQHEDINLITLLVGASAGGSQLLTSENKWVAVMPEADEIVINVGDMLQRADEQLSEKHYAQGGESPEGRVAPAQTQYPLLPASGQFNVAELSGTVCHQLQSASLCSRHGRRISR
jgi:hypothetical protein